MKNNPLVSIIVPCYNQAQYLDEALQSIIQQTYSNWECIIVNDESKDNTEEIAKQWIKKDSRFKYLFQNNAGVCVARNVAILNSKGEFILPLDADDKIGKNYIELAIEEFLKNKYLKVIYCKAEKFGMLNGLWNLKPFSLHNLALNNIIFNSAIFKRNDWELVGGYDVNMKYGREDWEFWISILKNGGMVLQLDVIGFYYRIKHVSREKNINEIQIKKIYKYLSLKHTDFYVNQLGSFVELYNELEEIKKSNSYLLGLKIKNILKKNHLLNVSRNILKKLF